MNLVSIFSLIAILQISLFSLEAFAYTIEIRPYGVPMFMGQTGVDIEAVNSYTGAYNTWQYPGFPPSSIFMTFYDSAMPVGSEFSVCAYYHDTHQLITCERYVAGYNYAEYFTFDLSP